MASKTEQKYTTTLETIWRHRPCQSGWVKLTNNLNRTTGEVTLKQILESNGIKDAIWALRFFEYRDYCLFLADVAESVLPLYEKVYPKDKRISDCIQAIRDWYKGEITKEELSKAYAVDADAAYEAAYNAAAYADAAADAYEAAYAAAATDAAAYDAAYAVASNVAAANADAADAAARQKQGQKTEKLFIKYFC